MHISIQELTKYSEKYRFERDHAELSYLFQKRSKARFEFSTYVPISCSDIMFRYYASDIIAECVDLSIPINDYENKMI